MEAGLDLREGGLLNENGWRRVIAITQAMFVSVLWAYFSNLPLLYMGIGGEERTPQAMYLKLFSPFVSCFSSCLVLDTVLSSL